MLKDMEEQTILSTWRLAQASSKALDTTQDELAQRAGCSVFALRKIGRGTPLRSPGLLNAVLKFQKGPRLIRVARRTN
jgi:hypothetical protein